MKGWPLRWQFQGLLAVEAGMEDRLHALVRTGIERECTAGGCFEPVIPIGFAQTQDAQTAAEALFGVGTGLKDLVDERGR